MDIINKSYTPFNSPIEYGLRCILILEAFYPTKLDLQDLVYYDYLLIHSADAGGPESVHPATPHRTTEITIKRDILEKSLFLMYSKNIINIEYSTEGILYSGNEETSPFIIQKFFPPKALATRISTRSTFDALTAVSAAIKIEGDVNVSIIPIASSSFIFEV